MKKMIAVFICLVIGLSLVGCKNVEKQNAEARTILTSVLNGERNFTFKSLVWNKTTEENLKRFNVPTVYSARNDFVPVAYMFVDLDSDGVDELIVADGFAILFLILRYDGEMVYGYIVEKINEVGADGSFLINRNNSHSEISRVTFDGLFGNVSPLAYKDDTAEVYQLNWEDAEKEAVEAYFADWDVNTTKMEWVNIDY